MKNSLNFHLHFQGNEKKVYDFIVRHFLATCSQDAQGQETTVEIKIAEEKVKLFLSFYDFSFLDLHLKQEDFLQQTKNSV